MLSKNYTFRGVHRPQTVDLGLVVSPTGPTGPQGPTGPTGPVMELTASRALISNTSGNISVSAVTSTELGYLDGMTSAIQTQLNGKAATNHTHTAAMTSAFGFMSKEDKQKLDSPNIKMATGEDAKSFFGY